MKNVDEFVKQCVKIDHLEQANCYGHYPFQLFVEIKDGSFVMNALALGGDVASCYRKVYEYKRDKAKKIFLSLDFPKGGDIQNDFIAVFSVDDKGTSVFAIPYDTESGDRMGIIKESQHLSGILKDFNISVN